MDRILHNLVQQSPEWHAFRLEHHGASEAAAMLGLSKNVTRSELLRAKHTGIPQEFSDFVQERILDRGHEVEALARPMAEEILGESLYPVTYSYGMLSASCDGLTMDGTTAFEHKLWAADLAAAVKRGELPDEHQPQCQQIMLVTGAERVLFMVSDGTPENCVHMFVKPDPVWFERIQQGWGQFEADLADYQPVEVIPAAVAAPTMALPAVSIQVQGAIALVSNLDVFGAELKAFIKRIPEKPSNDQEFADCKAACKSLQEAQDALDAAEASALGQVVTFDEMRRTKALYFDLARNTRLAVEKLVTAREQQIKVEIVQKGKYDLAEHIGNLNKRLGKPYMPSVPENFAGVIKSKRTVASLQNAVDTELARAKIEANATADRIQINLNALRELAADHAFLFADTATIVLKANDDFIALVKTRIADHAATEAQRLEAEREKIRAEEEVKATRKAEQDRAREEKRLMDESMARRLEEERLSRTGQPAAVQASPSVATADSPKGAAVPASAAAPKAGPPKPPTRVQIIEVVADGFGVSEETAAGWLVSEFQRAAA